MDRAMATDAAASVVRPLSPATPSPIPTSVRSRAAARTRDAILDAATALFIERGFRAVSLRDIAAEAGLSHPGVLRHFASKDEILEAVVDQLASRTEEWAADREFGLEVFAEIARHNARIEGYIPLFTTLAGEATSAAHPANLRFRERHATLRTRSAEFFESAIAEGALPNDTDVVGDSMRLAAAWDGLQLISLYLPERVDIPAMLEAHLDRLRGIQPAAAPSNTVPTGPLTAPSHWADDLGYAPGRARRARIVADASALFATRGFHATSLREIAERVGIGKSTLLHHFSSKEELLAAVVARRDATIDERSGFDPADAPLTMLLSIPDGARRDARLEPGLIELYAVLSAEAAAPTHPGHEYFRRRFEVGIARFAELFASAAPDLRPGLDPEVEAIWLMALWDGLQLQWLYDPESVDVADQLAAHLKQLVG